MTPWQFLPMRPDPSSGRPYVVTSRFGAPRSYGPHLGIDLATRDEHGTPVTGIVVVTPRAAVVERTGYDGRSGNYVVLRLDDGTVITYAHMRDVDVGEGERLNPGAWVGLSGDTGDTRGPHLHLEVEVRGALVDPEPYLASVRAPRRGSGGLSPIVVVGGGLTVWGLWRAMRRRR